MLVNQAFLKERHPLQAVSEEVKLQILAVDQAGNFGQHIVSIRFVP